MKSLHSRIFLLSILTIVSIWIGGYVVGCIVEGPRTSPTPKPTEKYQTSGDYAVTITVNDVERSFIIHVPPGYRPGVPTPLVLNIHAYSSNATSQERLSQMNAKADEEGFIVVNPQAQGNPSIWWGAVYGAAGQDDMYYFKEMIAYLQREMSIDPVRIYATGMSNGATMTNRLGCDMSSTLAAIAPVSGGHALYDLCLIDQPISVLVFHGMEDSVIPYDGDDTGIPPVHSWVEAWAERNGCDANPNVMQSGSTVIEESWENCIGDVEVTLISIERGRHDWPGSGFGPGPYEDDLAPDIYATDRIWKFFEAHPKPSQISVPTPLPTATTVPIEKYQKAGDYVESIHVSGYDRWFTVHLPPGYDPAVAVPLVINLHAYTANMFQQEELSQMNAKADEEGFIVVNPQAIGEPPSWWGPLPGISGQADRDFFVELLAYLQREINIDPARIFATGMSNGATMTNALGCVMSETFAAIAPVSGGQVDINNCVATRPVSVMAIHGTIDHVIPYYGREDEVPPVHLWVEAWAKRNHCDLTPQINQENNAVPIETWGNCDEEVVVTLYSLVDGGHTWPGAPLSATAGSSFPFLNATDVIWDFFETHPRPESND
jgi:polyhydroxybutyrate depolymerase